MNRLPTEFTVKAARILLLFQVLSSCGIKITSAGSLNATNCGAPDDTFQAAISPCPAKPPAIIHGILKFTPEVDVFYASVVWDIWYDGFHILRRMKENVCTKAPDLCRLRAHKTSRIEKSYPFYGSSVVKGHYKLKGQLYNQAWVRFLCLELEGDL